MAVRDTHRTMLVDTRLRKIENRLRRMETLFLKTLSTDKKIKREIELLEKEEKHIEREQKKLESEESKILQEMRHLEEEEKWHLKLQYNCRFKIMDDETNEIMCNKTKKICAMEPCPLWKDGKVI